MFITKDNNKKKLSLKENTPNSSPFFPAFTLRPPARSARLPRPYELSALWLLSGVAGGRRLWKPRRRKPRLGGSFPFPLRSRSAASSRPAAAGRRPGTRSPPAPPRLGRIAPCSHAGLGVTVSGAFLLTLLASLKSSLCAALRGHPLYLRVGAVSSWDADKRVAKGEIRGIRAKCDATRGLVTAENRGC